MSSGMNLEQAKEYAKTMTYRQAVSNCYHAKGIMFRKATLIKLHELAEIADSLDRKTEQRTCDNCGTPRDKCVYCIEEDRMWTPQTDERQELEAYRKCIKSRSFWDAKHCDACMFYGDCPFNPREDEDEPQTDCPWK